MKLRCRPPSLQNGLSALTTPAPLVQRLPTPPASVTTATRPSASASHARARDAGRRERPASGILDMAGHRQPVLRQPDAAGTQFALDLLVLHAVEPVRFEQRFQALRAAGLRILRPRQQVIEEIVHHAGEFVHAAAGGGEAFQLRAPGGGEIARFGAQQRRHGQGVITGGHEGARAGEDPRLGAALVDGEIVDHRLHGERHAMLHDALGLAHDGLHALLRLGLALRAEEESHAAAGHAAEHPEAPEMLAEFGARAPDQGVGIEVAGPGNDGLYGPVEILLRAGPDGSDLAPLQVAHHFIENADGLLAALPN